MLHALDRVAGPRGAPPRDGARGAADEVPRAARAGARVPLRDGRGDRGAPPGGHPPEAVELPANAVAMKTAKEHGDLRENFEYHAARQKHEYLSARIATIADELSRSRALDPTKIDASEVRVGTRVRLRDVATGAERDVTILGPWDSKPEEAVYSYQSEFAERLLGARGRATASTSPRGRSRSSRSRRGDVTAGAASPAPPRGLVLGRPRSSAEDAPAAADRRPGAQGPRGAARPRRGHRHGLGRAADARRSSPRRLADGAARSRRRGAHRDGVPPRREARHRGAPPRGPPRPDRPRDVPVPRAGVARRVERRAG